MCHRARYPLNGKCNGVTRDVGAGDTITRDGTDSEKEFVVQAYSYRIRFFLSNCLPSVPLSGLRATGFNKVAA